MKLKTLFKKKFYIYQYHRLKRKLPFDYIFFDWRVFLLLVLFFTVGSILFFPYKFEISFPSLEIQIDVLESILRVVSIFIGISFSFIILSFNVFYRYFGRYAFLDFFKLKSAKICLTLLICTIVLIMYSITFIRESSSKSSYTDFLFIFSIVVSIVSFFSIFPYFINLMRDSQSRENISHLFAKLDDDDYVIEKFIARIENKPESFYHKDPISLIYEIGIGAIKEFDKNTFELINSNIESFFRNRINKRLKEGAIIDVKEIYYNFTNLLTDFFEFSIKEHNSEFSNQAINTRYKIEIIVLQNIDNKSILEEFRDFDNIYKHWNFNFDFENYLKKAVKYNEDEICGRIIHRYHSFLTHSIVNLYPKNIIYNRENHYETAKLSEIVFDPLRILSNFSEILITHGKNLILNEIFTAFYVIEGKVLDIDTANSTKCFIYHVIHNYKKSIFQLFMESPETTRISYMFFPFKDSIRIYEKTDCKIPFFGALEMLNIIFSFGKLNNVVINQIKAEMLHLIRIKEFSNNLLISAIDKFVELSSLIKETDSNSTKDLYLKLIEKLEIIDNELRKQNNIPKEIIEKMEQAIKSFDKKSRFQEELKSQGFISDERIT